MFFTVNQLSDSELVVIGKISHIVLSCSRTEVTYRTAGACHNQFFAVFYSQTLNWRAVVNNSHMVDYGHAYRIEHLHAIPFSADCLIGQVHAFGFRTHISNEALTRIRRKVFFFTIYFNNSLNQFHPVNPDANSTDSQALNGWKVPTCLTGANADTNFTHFTITILILHSYFYKIGIIRLQVIFIPQMYFINNKISEESFWNFFSDNNIFKF